MAVKVTIEAKTPDGTCFTVEGDTVTEVVTAYKETYTGITEKITPTPTPDPPN